MTKGLFITGTDTGIGKTHASCLMIKYFAEQGKKVIGMKPIASGAKRIAGQLQNEDARALMQYSNVDVPYELVNPYCFEPAVAPHIAAEQAGVRIEVEKITSAYAKLCALADVVIIEGVGGWSVPIDDQQDVSDIVVKLDTSVVMTVGMRLGCLNHALLTAQSVQAKGCNLVGWLANTIDPNMLNLDANIQLLETRFQFPLIGNIPYHTSTQDIDISNVFDFKTLPNLSR